MTTEHIEDLGDYAITITGDDESGYEWTLHDSEGFAICSGMDSEYGEAVNQGMRAASDARARA